MERWRGERGASHTQELARVGAYKRGEGPDAEAATAHARKVAAFEADSASHAQLPPAEQARAAFILAASAPCPPVVYARSPWERGRPLPPRPFLGFDLECKPLGPADPDYMFVRGQLLLSVDDAFDVRVWSVRREVPDEEVVDVCVVAARRWCAADGEDGPCGPCGSATGVHAHATTYAWAWNSDDSTNAFHVINQSTPSLPPTYLCRHSHTCHSLPPMPTMPRMPSMQPMPSMPNMPRTPMQQLALS